ncbi:MAG: PEP-CTERM sorting domain-containing protein [Roseibacillus sp.]
MKKFLICPLALFASLSSLSAFSLDFTGFYESLGAEPDYSFSEGDSGAIAVDDYGFLTFIIPSENPSIVPLSDTYGDAALEFTDGQSILVQFVQNAEVTGTPTNVSLNSIGDGGTGTYSIFSSNPGEPVIGQITWAGANGGVESISFDTAVIPEPSVSLLGGVGMLALLRRRR